MAKSFCGKGGTAYKSSRVAWGTPQDLFDELDEEFHFTLDVCAQKHNAKCEKFFSPLDDGLAQNWGDNRCFLNPPFGREVGEWVRRAYRASRQGALVVCLIAARTDTRYWHAYVMKAAEVRLIQGRLKFEKGKRKKTVDPAPFPSAIVVFRPNPKKRRRGPRFSSVTPRMMIKRGGKRRCDKSAAS